MHPAPAILKTQLSFKGFTLAELLIALAILGVIATFTIPKIISTQQNRQSNTAAKEVASVVSAAYDMYKRDLAGPVSSGTTLEVLKPYINYIGQDTSALLQDHPGASNVVWNCAAGNMTCLKMASGGTLFWFNTQSFNGTANTNGLTFYFDPDSANVGSITTTNPGVSICFILYYNGRVVDRNNALAGSSNSFWSFGPGSGFNPTWFSW